MPSRADRATIERALRGAAWLALGALLLRTVRSPDPVAAERRVAGSAALPQALAAALEPASPPLFMTLDALPGAGMRQLARAVAAAGTPVRWREAPGATLPRLGVVAEPVADPAGRTRLTVLGGGAGALSLRDDAGALDSAQLSAAGVRMLEALTGNAVRAVVPRGTASTARRDSLVLRPVLVTGRAGWEGKFLVAALEEAGWRVDARLSVAPGAEVRQGDAAPIDTGRYAAVVALDPSVAPAAAAIARFVRSGGGLIVLPAAARVAAFAPLLPASVGDGVAAIPGALLTAEPRRGLGGVALTRLRPQAVVLEGDRGRPRVAGARVALGRVVLSGYDESWRWRMEGDDTAPAAHRAWWSGLVSSVAYAPVVPRVAAAGAAPDPAPFASLVSSLGAPLPATGTPVPPPARWPWEPILFALFALSLLGEWGSRRLRGAP